MAKTKLLFGGNQCTLMQGSLDRGEVLEVRWENSNHDQKLHVADILSQLPKLVDVKSNLIILDGNVEHVVITTQALQKCIHIGTCPCDVTLLKEMLQRLLVF